MKLAVLILFAAVGSLQPQEISNRISTPPRVSHKVEPEYTKEALDAKLQGTVILSAIVGVDGTPSEIKAVRELGKGLDESAVECVRQWRFIPAVKEGEPIPMKVTIQVSFRLPQH